MQASGQSGSLFCVLRLIKQLEREARMTVGDEYVCVHTHTHNNRGLMEEHHSDRHSKMHTISRQNSTVQHLHAIFHYFTGSVTQSTLKTQ